MPLEPIHPAPLRTMPQAVEWALHWRATGNPLWIVRAREVDGYYVCRESESGVYPDQVPLHWIGIFTETDQTFNPVWRLNLGFGIDLQEELR